MAEKPEPFAYLPPDQDYESVVTLIARGAGDQRLLTTAIRNEM